MPWRRPKTAGHSLLDLAGKNNVGCGQHEYSERLSDDHHAAGTYSATGIAPCMVANRISYFFNVDASDISWSPWVQSPYCALLLM